MWFSRGIAEGKITEQKARDAAKLDDVLGAAHDHRRDAVRFQMSCDQTHGLMTHGSIGGDDGRVDIHAADVGENIHAILLDGGFLAAVGGCADEF